MKAVSDRDTILRYLLLCFLSTWKTWDIHNDLEVALPQQTDRRGAWATDSDKTETEKSNLLINEIFNFLIII